MAVIALPISGRQYTMSRVLFWSNCTRWERVGSHCTLLASDDELITDHGGLMSGQGSHGSKSDISRVKRASADEGLGLSRERVETIIENRIQALVEASPDAIVIIRSSGEIALVNSQAERVFGPFQATQTGEADSDGGLPQAHLLGGSPDLADIPVMYVMTNDPPPVLPDSETSGLEIADAGVPNAPRRYWRGDTFDVYTGRISGIDTQT